MSQPERVAVLAAGVTTPIGQDLDAFWSSLLTGASGISTIERFPVGGHLSVRGYRENQIVRDQGVVTSLEVRVPVPILEGRIGAIQLAPFVDYGYASNRRNPTPDPDDLASVGIGLRWALGPAEAELYWGHGLVGVDTSGDLQDDGVQFRVGVRAF